MNSVSGRINKRKLFIVIGVAGAIITGVVFAVWIHNSHRSQEVSVSSREVVTSSSKEAGHDSVKKSSTKGPAAKKVFHEACLKHEKLCFKYPDGWKMIEGENMLPGVPGSEQMGVMVDDSRLESSSGEVVISMQSGITGVGGAGCGAFEAGPSEDPNRVTTIFTKRTAIKNTPEEYTSAADYIYVIGKVVSDGESKKHYPVVELVDRSEDLKLTERAACEAIYSSIIKGNIDLGNLGLEGSKGEQRITTDKAFGAGANSRYPRLYETFEEARKALESKPYIEAVNILSGVHNK